jgi:hypothetical protein
MPQVAASRNRMRFLASSAWYLVLMRIDVSDLFDDLYEVATFARIRFGWKADDDSDDRATAWRELCAALSDTLFLPACAKRAADLIGQQLSAAEIKQRIILERRPQTGNKVLYLRYLGPEFSFGPGILANHLGDGSSASAYSSRYSRPQQKVTLWLGKLPPAEETLEPPPYPNGLDAPLRWYARQYFGFCSRAPVTEYYEFHGDWCLRRVHETEGQSQRSQPSGQWLATDDLTEISQDAFEAVWESATD